MSQIVIKSVRSGPEEAGGSSGFDGLAVVDATVISGWHCRSGAEEVAGQLRLEPCGRESCALRGSTALHLWRTARLAVANCEARHEAPGFRLLEFVRFPVRLLRSLVAPAPGVGPGLDWDVLRGLAEQDLVDAVPAFGGYLLMPSAARRLAPANHWAVRDRLDTFDASTTGEAPGEAAM